jgi:hypothetical protein
MIYTPGPGDMLGQYSGHPHDPRTPDDGSDDTTAESNKNGTSFRLLFF